ncbi:MAG: hypothetical protein NTW60_02735, partial [Candidatus Wolfebacteria bacterium]|nr:hypothetical protein [Candidatus Wolfebacteria bacterium]
KIGESEPFDVRAASLGANPYALPVQSPGKKTLLVQALDMAGNVTAAAADFNVSPIAAPVIADYPNKLVGGDTFIVKGTALPNAMIGFYLRGDNDTKVETQDVKSDKDGNFTLVWRKKLADKIYEFWADATDERGAKSNPTDIYTFTSEQPGLLRFGSYVINYLSVIAFLVISCAALIIIVREMWKRNALKKDLDAAEKVITKEIQDIERRVG